MSDQARDILDLISRRKTHAEPFAPAHNLESLAALESYLARI